MRGLHVVELSVRGCFDRFGVEWDVLAEDAGSPFLSSAWLRAWTAAFAPSARCLICLDADGALVAGACLVPLRPIGVGAAANVETGEWAMCGRSVAARALLWRHLGRRGAGRVVLRALPGTAEDAQSALREAGYLVAVRESWDSPRLDLPETPAQLLDRTSRNLRSQYRRRTKALQQLGPVELRTTSEPADLEAFLALECAGWKRSSGTAITSRGRTTELYRSFAAAAAAEGWLRLQFLHVAGRTVGADLSCSYAGGVFMLKTAYDEELAHLSPGLVLRGQALEAAVRDGAAFYDFLGGAEPYKLRWGAEPRRHTTLHAHRPPVGAVPHLYHLLVRPRLKQARAQWEQGRRRLRATRAVAAATPVPPR